MPFSHLLHAALTVFVLTLAGCTVTPRARYVEKSPETGVIALPFNNTDNRLLADQLMREHFPEGFVVNKEVEFKTGSVTEHQEVSQAGPLSPSGIHQVSGEHVDHGHDEHVHHSVATEHRGVSTTRDTTEWRIYYSRKGKR